jgi:hypothetical protein
MILEEELWAIREFGLELMEEYGVTPQEMYDYMHR